MNTFPPKDTYLVMAKEMGALDAALIGPDDVKLDPRCYLKCIYGCPDWGTQWTCPSAPGAVSMEQFKEMLERYRYILLIRTSNKKDNQKISYAIERQAYIDGYYFAFSASDCGLCASCAFPKPCKFPHKARPAMQALGIDVFATAKGQNFPISTLEEGEDDKQNWYSLVLIE